MFNKKVVAFLLYLMWTPSSGHWRTVRFSKSIAEIGKVTKALYIHSIWIMQVLYSKGAHLMKPKTEINIHDEILNEIEAYLKTENITLNVFVI